MDAVIMKEKLHRFIETIEENRMKIIYAFFQHEIEEDEWDYTDEFKMELNRRYEYYLNGGVMVSAEEAEKSTKDLVAKLKAR